MDQKDNKHPVKFEVIGDWTSQMAYLKNQFPALTEQDLEYLPGREFELIGSIRSRLNKSFDEVKELIRLAEIEVR